MLDFSTHYGLTRPAAIAAKVAALQTRFAPVAIEAPAAPVLSLVPAAPSKAARVASMQTERATLRGELPLMRSALIEAAFYADFEGYCGPTPDEIEAMQSRLNDLDDYLILEPDFAAAPMLLAA
jgi:hypothetical protein